jgi:hypothetical protein
MNTDIVSADPLAIPAPKISTANSTATHCRRFGVAE